MLIYKAVCSVTGKVYIGQTQRSLEERVQDHKRNAEKDYKLGFSHFYSAIKKYGFDSFIFSLLEVVNTKEELDLKEIEYIQAYDATNPEKGYNLTKGGIGGSYWHSLSEQEKEAYRLKCSESQRESYKNNPERKLMATEFLKKGALVLKEMREQGITWIISDETRKKLSVATRERNLRDNIKPPSRKGSSHTLESKEKMSKASKGVLWSEKYDEQAIADRIKKLQEVGALQQNKSHEERFGKERAAEMKEANAAKHRGSYEERFGKERAAEIREKQRASHKARKEKEST